jgi:hypothetical protein
MQAGALSTSHSPGVTPSAAPDGGEKGRAPQDETSGRGKRQVGSRVFERTTGFEPATPHLGKATPRVLPRPASSCSVRLPR